MEVIDEMDHESIAARKSLDEKIGKVVLPLPILPPDYAADLLSLLQEADGYGELKTDVDEITMDVCNGMADLVVMAMDARDFDSFAHLPILSLTRKVAYFFVPFTGHLYISQKSTSVACFIKGSCVQERLRQLCGTTAGYKIAFEENPDFSGLKRRRDSYEETVGDTPDFAGFQSMISSGKQGLRISLLIWLFFTLKSELPVKMGGVASHSVAAQLIDIAFITGSLKMGIKEVTQALCSSVKPVDIVIMAADAQDLDRMLHLPILAKFKGASCIVVPTTDWLEFYCEFPPEYVPVSVCYVSSLSHPAVAHKRKCIDVTLDMQLKKSEKAESGFEPPLKICTFPTSRAITACP